MIATPEINPSDVASVRLALSSLENLVSLPTARAVSNCVGNTAAMHLFQIFRMIAEQPLADAGRALAPPELARLEAIVVNARALTVGI